ncbi:MAG: hypothetical protein SFX72_10275 [Isosphaeraceae bacterium]|nr:hypothetical protein [Isosphaeraceae bacterium]
MSPRALAGKRLAALGIVIATLGGLAVLPGCDPRMLAYFLQPNEPTVPAPGPDLKGKKVVLITHASDDALGAFQSLDREVNRELVRILRTEVKKIEIVDPEKVYTWMDGHPTWTNPGEIAKAFEADIAIFLEIGSFQIQDPRSPGLLEGSSEVNIQVIEYDHPKNTKGKRDTAQPKEMNKIYEETWKSMFPIRGPIPIDSGVSPSAFKTKFLKLLATELSWQFVGHRTGDDIQDVKFNSR